MKNSKDKESRFNHSWVFIPNIIVFMIMMQKEIFTLKNHFEYNDESEIFPI